MIYLICIDADGLEGPRKRITEWVHQTYESSVHPFSSCWIVDGPLAADQIYASLSPLLAPSDRLIIVKGATEAIWHGIDEEDAGWLADNFPASPSERIPGETEGLT